MEDITFNQSEKYCLKNMAMVLEAITLTFLNLANYLYDAYDEYLLNLLRVFTNKKEGKCGYDWKRFLKLYPDIYWSREIKISMNHHKFIASIGYDVEGENRRNAVYFRIKETNKNYENTENPQIIDSTFIKSKIGKIPSNPQFRISTDNDNDLYVEFDAQYVYENGYLQDAAKLFEKHLIKPIIKRAGKSR